MASIGTYLTKAPDQIVEVPPGVYSDPADGVFNPSPSDSGRYKGWLILVPQDGTPGSVVIDCTVNRFRLLAGSSRILMVGFETRGRMDVAGDDIAEWWPEHSHPGVNRSSVGSWSRAVYNSPDGLNIVDSLRFRSYGAAMHDCADMIDASGADDYLFQGLRTRDPYPGNADIWHSDALDAVSSGRTGFGALVDCTIDGQYSSGRLGHGLTIEPSSGRAHELDIVRTWITRIAGYAIDPGGAGTVTLNIGPDVYLFNNNQPGINSGAIVNGTPILTAPSGNAINVDDPATLWRQANKFGDWQTHPAFADFLGGPIVVVTPKTWRDRMGVSPGTIGGSWTTAELDQDWFRLQGYGAWARVDINWAVVWSAGWRVTNRTAGFGRFDAELRDLIGWGTKNFVLCAGHCPTRWQAGGSATPTTTAIASTAAGVTVNLTSSAGWPTSGVFRIDKTGTVEVGNFTRSGTTLTLTLRGGYGTTAATHAIGDSIEVVRGTFPDPQYEIEWAAFCEDVATRYLPGNGVVPDDGETWVEVWNEPNITGRNGDGLCEYRYYARLYKLAYDAVRAALPDQRVMPGGPAPQATSVNAGEGSNLHNFPARGSGFRSYAPSDWYNNLLTDPDGLLNTTTHPRLHTSGASGATPFQGLGVHPYSSSEGPLGTHGTTNQATEAFDYNAFRLLRVIAFIAIAAGNDAAYVKLHATEIGFNTAPYHTVGDTYATGDVVYNGVGTLNPAWVQGSTTQKRWLRTTRYKCTAPHTATSSNRPGAVGAPWVVHTDGDTTYDGVPGSSVYEENEAARALKDALEAWFGVRGDPDNVSIDEWTGIFTVYRNRDVLSSVDPFNTHMGIVTKAGRVKGNPEPFGELAVLTGVSKNPLDPPQIARAAAGATGTAIATPVLSAIVNAVGGAAGVAIPTAEAPNVALAVGGAAGVAIASVSVSDGGLPDDGLADVLLDALSDDGTTDVLLDALSDDGTTDLALIDPGITDLVLDSDGATDLELV